MIKLNEWLYGGCIIFIFKIDNIYFFLFKNGALVNNENIVYPQDHLAPARCSEANRVRRESHDRRRKKHSHVIISALQFTWLSWIMTEVGVRRSSLSTMAFTSVLLFIFSIYSCYAQVPLLMWTSDGYVTRLFFEYCFYIVK